MSENVFTPEEVLSLNEYQNSGVMHPFTCGGGHRTEHPDGEGLLVATTQGWICPYCEYRQDWAHDWMKNGDWRKLSIQRRVNAQQGTVTRLKTELKEEEDLRERMRKILDETANALHGGPLKNGLWSWHDLPALAEELLAHLRSYRDSSMVHSHCATYDPTLGREIDSRCGTCKAVDFILNRPRVQARKVSQEEYDWRLITPDDLPGFDDLLLQDMLPPEGAWSVTNKHYNRPVSYEEWMKSGFLWFAKMRRPKVFPEGYGQEQS